MFDLQQDRGMRNIPDAFGSIYWDKKDDNLIVPIELAICYKANCQNEEIGPLWSGIIDQAKMEEVPERILMILHTPSISLQRWPVNKVIRMQRQS